MTSLPITIPSLISLSLVKVLNCFQYPTDEFLKWETVSEKYINMQYCQKCQIYIAGEPTIVSNWMVYYHDRIYHDQDLPHTQCTCRPSCEWAIFPRNTCCLRCQQYFHNTGYGALGADTSFDMIDSNGIYHLSSGYESCWDNKSFLLDPRRVHEESPTWKVLQKVKTGKRKVQEFCQMGGFRGNSNRPGTPRHIQTREIEGTIVKPVIPIESRHISGIIHRLGNEDEIICDNCILDMLRMGELKYKSYRRERYYRCEICEIFYDDNQDHYAVTYTYTDYNNENLIIRLAWDPDEDNNPTENPNTIYRLVCTKTPRWYQDGSRICRSCFHKLKISIIV